MHVSRRRVEELLWVLGLNKITSPIWERLRGGRAMGQSRLMREFYAPLLTGSEAARAIKRQELGIEARELPHLPSPLAADRAAGAPGPSKRHI